MGKWTSDWGGARSNGRMRYRVGGRFAKAPALDVDVCPQCRRINVPKIEPVYNEMGMIYPQSMKPKRATVCHACGCNFAEYEANKQLDNYINALSELVRR